MSSFGRVRSRVLKPAGLGTSQHTSTTTSGTSCNTYTSTKDWSYWLQEVDQVTEDTVTPNFNRVIADGAIVNHAFRTTKTTINHPQPTYHHRRFGTVQSGNSCGYELVVAEGMIPMADTYKQPLLVVPDLGAMRQSVIDKAVQAAHANIDVSEMLAVATLAESRKTVDFLVNSGKKLLNVVRKARKLDLKGLRKELSAKELSERYMELRYAVRPLLYDINGVLSVLDKVSRPHDRYTARGYASDTYQQSDTLSDKECGWKLISDVERTINYSVSARAGVLSHVNVTTSQLLGTNQIFETAWEIMPFSFIVDWFVDVGQAIAAVTPNAGVTQLASWVTVKEKTTVSNSLVDIRSTLVGYDYADSVTWSSQHGYETERLERIINPTMSVWPMTNISLDAFKLTDLGIILKKALR